MDTRQHTGFKVRWKEWNLLSMIFVAMDNYLMELDIITATDEERSVTWNGKKGKIIELLLDPINNILVFAAENNETGLRFYGWKQIEFSDTVGIMVGWDNPLFMFPS